AGLRAPVLRIAAPTVADLFHGPHARPAYLVGPIPAAVIRFIAYGCRFTARAVGAAHLVAAAGLRAADIGVLRGRATCIASTHLRLLTGPAQCDEATCVVARTICVVFRTVHGELGGAGRSSAAIAITVARVAAIAIAIAGGSARV